MTATRTTTPPPPTKGSTLTFKVDKDPDGRRGTLSAYVNGRQVGTKDPLPLTPEDVWIAIEEAKFETLKAAAAARPSDDAGRAYLEGIAEGASRAFDKLVNINVDTALQKAATASKRAER